MTADGLGDVAPPDEDGTGTAAAPAEGAPQFDHERYRAQFPDLAATFKDKPPEALIRHYRNNGRIEFRGQALPGNFNIESVQLSSHGDVVVTGWVDRRVMPVESITVSVGYQSVTVPAEAILWTTRPDVAKALQSGSHDCVFMLVARVDPSMLARSVRVAINRSVVLDRGDVPVVSGEHFILRLLDLMAFVADRPLSETAHLDAVAGALARPVWRRYLRECRFTLGLARHQEVPVSRTVVIVLYRDFGDIHMMLHLWSGLLRAAGCELVIVANGIAAPEPLVRRLDAFLAFEPLPVRLYLCSANAGFGGGANFGASQARTGEIILMNPDLLPGPAEMAGHAAPFTAPLGEATIQGARLHYPYGGVMHDGMYALREPIADPARNAVHHRARVEHYGKDLAEPWRDASGDPSGLQGFAEERLPAMMASGAFLRFPRDFFDSLGGFDDDYLFAYYEDADLCLRAVARGGEVTVERDSTIIHCEGVGRNSSPWLRSATWLNRALFSRLASRFAAEHGTEVSR